MKYTVMEKQEGSVSGDVAWVEVATVHAEKRERRSTIIRKALGGEGEHFAEGRTLRVLDEASAREITVKAVQQTTLEIS
jgi:hypothetical protein